MIQTAIIYTRISSEDQSNWSITGQERTCREHCEKRGIQVLKVFSDETSGKSFDRPGWKQLILAVKTLKPTFVICAKYDRISRNAAESLALIEKIELSHKCRFLSALEEVPISPHSPFFFKMRADMLVNAHFELLVIRDRTSKGRYDAAREGRFSGPAPYGYDNGRDENKKPILVINEREAAVVASIYEDYLNGKNFAQIKRDAYKKGFTINSKSAVQRVLTNPLYCGKVVVPSYAGSEQRIAPGKQAAIVSERTFWAVQDKLSASNKKTYQDDDAVPLRGVLICEGCGKPMTSSRSRGNGGVFHYYFCHRHSSKSFRVEKVHDEMTSVLSQLCFDENTIEAMRIMAKAEVKRLMKEQLGSLEKAESDLKRIETQILSLEDKLIKDVVNHETYARWKPDLEMQKAEAQEKIKAASGSESSIWKIFEENIPMLGRIDKLYEICSTDNKKKVLNVIFGENLIKTENGFRTNYVMPIMYDKALHINNLQVEKATGPCSENEQSPVCTSYGNTLEPIIALFRIFANLYAA